MFNKHSRVKLLLYCIKFGVRKVIFCSSKLKINIGLYAYVVTSGFPVESAETELTWEKRSLIFQGVEVATNL